MLASCLLSTLGAALGAQDQAAKSTSEPRLHTSRPAGRELIRLPKEDDAFGFVIFGDRTSGRPEGIEVLRQAVADTNLLDADLVMTVGDLVQGYNARDAWLAQAAEFRSVMDQLRMPWFPVAGNHDVYWRGEGKPVGEHEGNYETVFGPLWYAFRHKQCWFVALYSDEGNPATGEKNFQKPECQRMSDAQFAWLQEVLQKAKGANHVFVFLHHPRWLERYGDDWQKVHEALVAAGNVSAVFAGHIHRMRYDGNRDGIEYFTLATTGGNLDMELPQAGYLHEYHVVTVRPQGIQVATLPVGTVIDPREVTGEVSEDANRLEEKLVAVNPRGLAFGTDGSGEGMMQADFTNPASRPIELTVTPLGSASWTFQPDHTHVVIPPGATTTVSFVAARKASGGEAPDLPRLELAVDYFGRTLRFTLPRRQVAFAQEPPESLAAPAGAPNGVLRLSGADCLEVPSARMKLPDGPFTLEAWVRGNDFAGRRALVTKTESSEYGIFVTDGRIEASVYLGNGYVTARTAEPVLKPGTWHHVAGVFDGAEVRCYLDGRLVARKAGSGKRKTNALPLLVGADPDGKGLPNSFLDGDVDDLRIRTGAHYRGERFDVPTACSVDADTVLLLACDADAGPWAIDSSSSKAHPWRRGSARCVLESRAASR